MIESNLIITCVVLMLVGDIDPCNVLLKCKCLIKTGNHIKTHIIPYVGEITLWTTWIERNKSPLTTPDGIRLR